MLPRLLLMLACCLLTACSSGPRPMPAPVVQILPPASLTTPPPPLPPPASGRMLDLEANHRDTARLYHLLASQMCGLLTYLQAPIAGCEPWTKSTLNKPMP
jgi:hypothetical protein